jgi:hypothetical protein
MTRRSKLRSITDCGTIGAICAIGSNNHQLSL